jgi:signal transduction histidine kinase
MNELRLDARPHMAAGLVAEAIEQCRPSAADKGIAIHTRFADRLTVTADRTALITVLRNVIGNALKFSEPGGAVEVRTTGIGQCGVVEVRDTGIGMTAETLSSLFDPAHQNTRPGTRGEGGSGLGLQICSELMERQAGTLTIDSAPGRGTIVRLSLPVQNAPIQNAPAREARPA